MKLIFFTTILFIINYIHLAFGETIHSVAVKGSLNCGKSGADNVIVRLHRSKNTDPKQIIGRQTTGPTGLFQINANTQNRVKNDSIIDSPVISFYHNCNDDAKTKEKKGFRQFQLTIPQNYVNQGSKANKVYDIGAYNLQVEYPNEKRVKNIKS